MNLIVEISETRSEKEVFFIETMVIDYERLINEVDDIISIPMRNSIEFNPGAIIFIPLKIDVLLKIFDKYEVELPAQVDDIIQVYADLSSQEK